MSDRYRYRFREMPAFPVLYDIVKELSSGHVFHYHEYIGGSTDHLIPGFTNFPLIQSKDY